MAADSTTLADRAAAMIAGGVPAADWLVVLPVAIPLTVGALLLVLRHEMRWHALAALIGLGAGLAANLALLMAVIADGPRAMVMGSWLPPFGIAFTADLLGAGFSCVAAFVCFVCCIFSARDIGTSGRRYGFYPFLMLLMAGVSGAFLTGDVFNLYVWFEVFVISSFGLLILGSERAQLDGATKYAILNLVATTLFLIAVGLLYGAFGTLNMADLAIRIGQGGAGVPLLGLGALFLLAFGMKAAAFPLNFWLPASYHTPRIVVAALFGGLLTKVGVYALLRVLVMLMPGETVTLSGIIGWAAGATMILGAMGALAQSDVRRMAGFLVISGVGVMLAGIAIGDAAGLSGAIFYAAHSMLAMTGLYLLSAMMREQGASFSLYDLGGLYRDAPWLSALAILLFLAVAGLPPGSGLWPKVMLVKASLDAGAWWLAAAILVSSLMVTIALFRTFALAFWRPRPDEPPAAVRQQPLLASTGYVALILLALPIAWLGLWPETVASISMSAAAGLIDPSPYINAVFPVGGTP